jgi:hypothetical protein
LGLGVGGWGMGDWPQSPIPNYLSFISKHSNNILNIVL